MEHKLDELVQKLKSAAAGQFESGRLVWIGRHGRISCGAFQLEYTLPGGARRAPTTGSSSPAG